MEADADVDSAEGAEQMLGGPDPAASLPTPEGRLYAFNHYEFDHEWDAQLRPGGGDVLQRGD